MPRQNFFSKESFVAATEKQSRDSLLSIPAFVKNVRLISDNKMIESIKFSYEQPVKKTKYHINVSVLPLNDQFTRICLHGTYANGQAFNNNTEMAIVLHDFEMAMEAAIKGDVSLYEPQKPRENNSKKFFQFAASFIALVGIFFLRKKLSE